MADYCSNKIDFIGDNRQAAFDHFSQMGYDSPPFHDILISDEAVYFESRWIPPLRDLNRIAEQFDVDYKLTYQLPNERKKEKYSYTCLHNEKFGGPAATLAAEIKRADSLEALEKSEHELHELGDKAQLNNHERSLLAHLIGKRSEHLLGVQQEQQLPDQDIHERRPKR